MDDGRASPSIRPPRPGWEAGLAVAGISLVVGLAPWPAAAVDAGWTATFAALTAVVLIGLAASPADLAGPRLAPRAIACALLGLVGLGMLQTLPLGSASGWLASEANAVRAPFSPTPALSTISLYPYETRLAALGIAVGLTLGWLAARTARDGERAAALLKALTIAAGVVALYGIVDRLLGEATRAAGPFRSPNHFAAFLALFLPTSLALATDDAPQGTSRRSLWLLVSGALLIGVLVSVSRSGLIAAVVGIAIYVWLTARGDGRRTLLTVVGLTGLLLLVGVESVARRFERLTSEPELNRIAFWRLGLSLFAQFPALGAGLRSHDQLTPALFPNPKLLNATHNDYVNLLCDVGVVGGLLLLVAALGIGRAIRANLRRLPQGAAHRLAAAATAGCAALLVISLVEFNLQIRANLWAFCVLVGVALGIGRARPRRSRPPPRGLRAALALGAALLLVNAVPIGLSRLHAKRGEDLTRSSESRLESLAAAESWAPENGMLPTLRARLLIEQDRPAEAVVAATLACRREPRNAVHHNQLARAYLAHGRWAEARQELQRAALLAPHFALVRLHSAKLWWWLYARTRDAEDRALGGRSLQAALTADPTLLEPACEAILELPTVRGVDLQQALPSDPELRRAAARWLSEQGAIGLAAAVMEPLVDAGRYQDAQLLARLRLAQGRALDAALLFSQAVANAPETRRGQLLRQAVTALLERHAELAERLCREVRARRPENARASHELGRALIVRQQPREAIEHLKRSQTLGLEESLPLLGYAHWVAGHREQALAVWEQGLDAPLSTPVQQAIRLRLAEAYKLTRRTEDARRMLDLILALDPNHGAAKAMRRELGPQ